MKSKIKATFFVAGYLIASVAGYAWIVGLI
jgi:hypothetical protein